MRDQPGAPPLPHSGRPRQADRARRTEALLQCAARLFFDRGYQQISLESIAREAHVAVRTIYVKFGGKPGLFKAVVQSRCNAGFPEMSPMALDGRALDEVLCDFARDYVHFVTLPETLAMLRMVLAEAHNEPELCREFVQAGPQRTRTLLSRFFAQPDVAALLRPDSTPDNLATDLMSCLLGDRMLELLLTGAATHPPFDDDTTQALVRLFLAARRRH